MDTRFVYYFVDLDLTVEILFGKEGATKEAGVDFERGD